MKNGDASATPEQAERGHQAPEERGTTIAVLMHAVRRNGRLSHAQDEQRLVQRVYKCVQCLSHHGR